MADPTQDLLEKSNTGIAVRAVLVNPWDIMGRGMGIYGHWPDPLWWDRGQTHRISNHFCQNKLILLDFDILDVEQVVNMYCG